MLRWSSGQNAAAWWHSLGHCPWLCPLLKCAAISCEPCTTVRVAIADGTLQHRSNFVALVSLHIMQPENRAITRRQPLDSPRQVEAIDRSRRASVLLPGLAMALRRSQRNSPAASPLDSLILLTRCIKKSLLPSHSERSHQQGFGLLRERECFR